VYKPGKITVVIAQLVLFCPQGQPEIENSGSAEFLFSGSLIYKQKKQLCSY